MAQQEYHETVAPPTPAPETHHPYASLENGLLLPVLQNLAGGLSLAVLVTLALIKRSGFTNVFDFSDQALKGLVVGLVVFCLVTVVRVWKDEAGIITAAAMQAYIRWHDKQTIDALRQQVTSLEKALKETGLSKQARDGYESQNDAFRLLALALLENRSISRDACAIIGIGRHRWDRAMRLLKNSGIMGEHYRLSVVEYPAAVSQLQTYLLTSTKSERAADGNFYKV